jgi:hypothetical protein
VFRGWVVGKRKRNRWYFRNVASQPRLRPAETVSSDEYDQRQSGKAGHHP